MKPALSAALALAAAVLAQSVAAHAAGTLDKVRAAGALGCGVVAEQTDFTKADTHGSLEEFGAELCKAFATAVLGASAGATLAFYPDEQTAFRELAAGHVDVLAGVTPSPSNAARYGVAFGPPIFFDGQGFMVNRKLQVHSLRDLAGRQVCFIANTENETQLDPAIKAAGIQVTRYPFEETGEMDAALVSGHCAAITADISWLAEQRAAFHDRKVDFAILPDMVTFDPLAPAMRQDDPHWGNVVAGTVEALIQAEASGVTRANVQTMRGSDDPAVRRLLGRDRAAARALGLPDDWAAGVIRALGNYGEIYARTLGSGSQYNLPRGRNALWSEGGLLYPLPIR